MLVLYTGENTSCEGGMFYWLIISKFTNLSYIPFEFVKLEYLFGHPLEITRRIDNVVKNPLQRQLVLTRTKFNTGFFFDRLRVADSLDID